jgi:DNA-binding transcriptional LysR family regulator
MFCEAPQRLSFARAAERLHLSLAGVSFQIKRIESAAGFPLFERVGKRLALTNAGQGFLVYATIVLRALDDAEQALMALSGGAGRNSVGVGDRFDCRHFDFRSQDDES